VSEFQVIHEKSESFYDNYDRKGEMQHQTHYCPGCGHGVAHKLIGEALEDMGLQDRALSAPSAVPYSRTTISIPATCRQRMDAHRPSRRR
jgi:pyruvate/2-oxoacid:ferredoxin oxidoreductase beta subunit